MPDEEKERERVRNLIRQREMEGEGMITEQISVQAKRNTKEKCLGDNGVIFWTLTCFFLAWFNMQRKL